jgi:hypothetical protein
MSNSFTSYTNVLKVDGKAEQIIKTFLPLEIAKYNATCQKGYELPTYFNVVVGSPISDNDLADGKPWVNLFSDSAKFTPSSIIGCRDEVTNYVLTCFLPDSPRATRTSVPMARMLARLVADLLEKYLVDSPGDENGICSRINWLSDKAGIASKTGAACELLLEMFIRSHSEYEPIRMTPYFNQISTIVPPVFEQNWIPELIVELDSEPEQTAHTLKNLTYTVSSVSELSLTFTDSKLDVFYCWLPSPLINQQLLSAGTVGVETVSVDLSTWNTNVFSLLDPGDKAVLRIVTWNADTAQSSMFSIELTKEA